MLFIYNCWQIAKWNKTLWDVQLLENNLRWSDYHPSVLSPTKIKEITDPD